MVDSLTLTVNTRLARWLLFHHSRQQAQADRKIWEAPAIYFLNDWLRQTWLNSWPDYYVLTELQSRHLWQKIIREDAETSSLNLLHIQGAAGHAASAYQLIRQYRLPDHPAQFNSYTEETKTFRRWMSLYQDQLKNWRALDPSELIDNVSQRMEEGHIVLPRKIIFNGFDEITPQMQDWLDFLKSKNVSTHFLPSEPTSVTPENLQNIITQKRATVQKYEDANEEVIQCARWIRSTYKVGKTIGIIVPNLEDYRGIIEREFKAELAPESVYPWKEISAPFNLSLGTPLSHEPMVHLALLLLSQRRKRMPLLTFSTLITSPFLKCPPEEKKFRRELDWSMRGDNLTHVYLPQAIPLKDKKRGPALIKFLDIIMKWVDDKSFRLPSEWAGEITKLLKNAGWPRGFKESEDSEAARQNLSSRQYQALDSWKSGLDSLATLDRVLSTINRYQAVSHLTYIIGETLFQPQTHEEPIQVVGLLESAGMEFDDLWIMGCHADTLPPVPNPNPFLPFIPLQIPHNLPHSTAERELAHTEQTLFRLAHSCERLVFSYPTWQGETELVPSPLLASWQMAPHTIHNSVSSKLQDHSDFSISLDSFDDFSPIPVTPEEKKVLKGGSGIIKRQAGCPFQAFAVHRLVSQQKDFSELDMDELARGSLVHKILEVFWNEVSTSVRLHELHESGELPQQIQKSITEAMTETALDVYGQTSFFELEKERLSTLMLEWMERERERGDFKISDLEKVESLDLSGLTLRLTVDRIDQSSDGKTAIIDYKSGANQNTKKWFGERIEEPQLPLYSLIAPADALAFATVRRGESRYKGLASGDNLIPGTVSPPLAKGYPEFEHWDEVTEYWKVHLNQTAQEFLDGVLTVDPLRENETCRICDQKTFCRKAELLNHFEEEDA